MVTNGIETVEDRYNQLVAKYGQQLVDNADEAIASMEAAARSLADMERAEPEDGPDGYTYSLTEQQARNRKMDLERAQRRLTSAERRVVAMWEDEHSPLRKMVEDDADFQVWINGQSATHALGAEPANVVSAAEHEQSDAARRIELNEEQQLRYAVSGSSADAEAKRLADSIVSLADDNAPAAAKTRQSRAIFDNAPDPATLFRELYQDVARAADDIPLGALEDHAHARLKQSLSVLCVVEQARAAGLLPTDGQFEAAGAAVQDKRASRDYPAAHSLPCDLKFVEPNGRENRLPNFFEVGLDKVWLDRNLFASTDRVHRMVNVADHWCEDAGMKRSLVDAANAVQRGRLSAAEAMYKIVEPGYESAIEKALEKIERNFSLVERHALASRIVDSKGQPFRGVDDRLALKKGSEEARAAAKDAIERTLKAYKGAKLTPEDRMQAALTGVGIVSNEKLIANSPRGRTALSPVMARLEAKNAFEEARRSVDEEMKQMKQLAAKAKQAVAAAQDVTRPMAARQRAAGDALVYSEKMKTAWAVFKDRSAPSIARRMNQRLEGTGTYADAPKTNLRAIVTAPPPVLKDTADAVENMRDRLEMEELRLERENRQRQTLRPGVGPRM